MARPYKIRTAAYRHFPFSYQHAHPIKRHQDKSIFRLPHKGTHGKRTGKSWKGNGDSEASDAPSESSLDTSPLLTDNPGQAFLSWVKEGILSHKLIINDSKAKIHTVSGNVFLVAPGLFQLYEQEFPGITNGADQEIEKWRWVQKQFEKLKVLRKRDDGL